MDRKNLTGKWILIAAVLGLCGLLIYLHGLNLGLDLKGGTSLLYEVNTAGAPNPEEVIKQTIAVLSKRVDPTGTKNLIWRVETGSRIEIQIPQAPPEAKQAREKLDDLMGKLEASNISRSQLSLAVQQTGPARDKQLEALSRGVAGRAELLKKLAAAHDDLQASRAAYEKVKADEKARIAPATAVAAAEKAYDDAVAAVLNTNIDRARVGGILEMSSVKTKGKDADVSPRDKALAKLIEEHPERKDQINQVVAAYDAYQKVRGPLDDANDLIRLLKGSGVLEFRIAVSNDEVGAADQARATLAEKGPRLAPQPNMGWFILDDLNSWADNARQMAELQSNPAGYLGARGLVAGEYGGKIYVLLWDSPDKSLTGKQQGWELAHAGPTQDPRTGFLAVSFQMNNIGAGYMGALTGNNIHRQMAIVLDGRVYSAPTIQSQISDSGQITGGRGGFSPQQLDYLVRTLNAGTLKARLSEEPISIQNIGPSLGADNLDKGLRSVEVAIIGVGAFMIVYYFFGGFVAMLAVAANLIILTGVMAGINGTFTLPGIAGIVLTIGMCVDANVLIFERIREELNRGCDMSTALRLGYERAFSAIIDGHMTTLITSVVLYYAATADIAGFGLTLGVGIAATLFSSLFMTHIFYLTWYGLRGSKQKMKMLPIVVPSIEKALHPHFDWLGKRHLFYAFSGILCVISIVLCFARGANFLDVEFRGGTEVGFELKEGQMLSMQDVRDKLAKTNLPDLSVIAVGKLDDKFRGNAFSVVTSQTDPKKVTAAVQDALQGQLRIDPVVSFKAGNVTSLKGAPVFPIKSAHVGNDIGRPNADIDAGDAVGGVAIVVEDMNPPQSVADLTKRIKAMRLQPDFESATTGQTVQFRPFEVRPLATSATDANLLTAAVVMVKPESGASYFEDQNQWEANLANVEWNVVRNALSRSTSLSKVSNFTPTVARTLTQQAVVAFVIASLAIIAYVWVRFGSLRWGAGAVLSLVHDIIITMGCLAAAGYLYEAMPGFAGALHLEPFKINMTLVAAILTILGYSINDTIVVYDRIRENKGKLPLPTLKIMNDAVSQTFSRTLLTSVTVFVSALVLYIIAGEAIRGFAFAMMIGVITGTYSSWAIAAPLLLLGRGKEIGTASGEPSAPTATPPQPAAR
jgi:SecD/SecF fusion protein